MNNTEKDDLWSGQSVYCKCGHHVQDHNSGITRHIMQGGDTSFYYYCKNCDCKEFKGLKEGQEKPSEFVGQDGVEF